MKLTHKHAGTKVVRDSKFRQVIVEARSQISYFDISASDAASGYGEQVAASGSFVAFASAVTGEIGALPLKSVGKRSAAPMILRGHGGAIGDLSFSTLDYALLASGGSDATCNVWRLPDEPVAALSPAVTLGDHARVVTQVRFHPSAAGVLATAAASTVRVWDVEAGAAKATYDASGADVYSVAWTWDGARVALSSNDKCVRIVDPRSKDAIVVIQGAHAGPKSILVEWAGPNEALFSAGVGATRDREVCTWDLRDITKPLVRTRIDSNAGAIRPLYDPDTGLLVLSGHGDASVRVYEADFSTEPFLHPIGVFAASLSAEGARGACLVPKAGLDVMNCEVLRVLRLTRACIEAVAVEVPRRKSYRGLMDDLFPPTRTNEAAATAEAYFAGGNTEPLLAAVKGLVVEHSTSEDTVTRVAVEVADDDQVRRKAAELVKEENARLAERHEDLDKRFSKFLGYQAKLKFTKVTQGTRDETCFNLTPDLGGSDATVLAASSSLFVVPWKAGAGPVYVGSLNKPGKHPSPADAVLVYGHKQSVTTVAASEFDAQVFATGSDDCSLRVWRFPADGVTSKDEAEACVSASVLLEGGHRLAVRGVGFHRVAANVVASWGSDVSLKLWDAAKGGPAVLDMNADTVLGGAAVSSADWSYDGALMLLAGRDSKVRVVDPRSGKVSTAAFQAHDGVKAVRAVWLGKEPVVLTTGFGRTGDRQFRLFDLRNATKPMTTTPLDAGAAVMQPAYVDDSAAVVLWAKGEHSIRVYEVEGLVNEPANSTLDIGRGKRHVEKYALHSCTEFRATGDPSAAIALLPRRCVDPYKAEWLRAVRLTASAVEPLSFTVPRAADLAGFFSDELFPLARSSEPAIDTAEAWFAGATQQPRLVDLNARKLPLLSQRPVEQALEKVKKSVANTDRFRQEREEAEAKKKQHQEALDRMARLARQHEEYNPNLSKPGVGGHEAASSTHAVDTGPKDVEDEEWGD